MKVELTEKRVLPDIAVFMYEGATALAFPPEIGRKLAALAKAEGVTGKDKELAVVHPTDHEPAPRVLVLGLGARKNCTPETFRQRIAAAVKRANELKSPALDVLVPAAKDLRGELPATIQAMIEASHLTSYKFDKYKAPPKEQVQELTAINLVLPDRRLLTERMRRLAREAEAVAAGVLYARDLANEPPGNKTPEQVGRTALKLALPGRISVKLHHKADIEKLGMGGLLSVAAGSSQPPVFLHLEYEPSAKVALAPRGGAGHNPKKARKTVVLVGKGLTFDSGGLSLKTGTFMNNMKNDVSGGAAVLGLFHALRTVDLPLKIHGLVPLTENMPGGGATKLGDVFKAYNGKTVEVLNTDAEGRLILCDALAYGAKLKPDLMIDMATLTGACVVALGPVVTGVLGTARKHIRRLVEMGRNTGEHFWELPLFEDYREWGKSRVADLNNIGKPGKAGTIFAGLFLQEFVGDVPWIHLDIAGAAWVDVGEDKGYLTYGGTGVPIRSLFALLREL